MFFKTNYHLIQVKSIVEHSAILLTVKLPFVIKIIVLSTFEWPYWMLNKANKYKWEPSKLGLLYLHMLFHAEKIASCSQRI